MNEEKELWEQLRNQLQKLMDESGVRLDENYENIFSENFGMSKSELDELERETIKALSTKKLKVQKLHPDAIIPKYAYPTDSGFDLFSVEDLVLNPSNRAVVSTGIKLQFDENLEVQIRPKSGLASNYGITVLNTPGTVDYGYNGEIKVILFNTNQEPVTIKKGMKIAQGVLCPVINGNYVNIEEVNEVEEKDRGENGFGSTGI
jgi:dUTP pyrophosphatase